MDFLTDNENRILAGGCGQLAVIDTVPPDWQQLPDHSYEYRVLDRNVLAVVSINSAVGDCAVYIGAVPGHDHDNEWQAVAAVGSKVSETIALAIFPWLKEYEYRDF